MAGLSATPFSRVAKDVGKERAWNLVFELLASFTTYYLCHAEQVTLYKLQPLCL